MTRRLRSFKYDWRTTPSSVISLVMVLAALLVGTNAGHIIAGYPEPAEPDRTAELVLSARLVQAVKDRDAYEYRLDAQHVAFAACLIEREDGRLKWTAAQGALEDTLEACQVDRVACRGRELPHAWAASRQSRHVADHYRTAYRTLSCELAGRPAWCSVFDGEAGAWRGGR